MENIVFDVYIEEEKRKGNDLHKLINMVLDIANDSALADERFRLNYNISRGVYSSNSNGSLVDVCEFVLTDSKKWYNRSELLRVEVGYNEFYHYKILIPSVGCRYNLLMLTTEIRNIPRVLTPKFYTEFLLIKNRLLKKRWPT